MAEAESGAGTGRRMLAAILFTDAVGFSGLASRNEPRALDLMQADLALIRRAGSGSFVAKSTGDGMLFLFASAVDAVQAGLGILRALESRSGDALLQHRIGIHLGDVVATEDDAFGDGVNVAARIQQEAQPGQVYISQTVYDVVKGKVPFHAEYLGPKEMKNLAESVAVWRIAPSGDQVTTVAVRPEVRKPIPWASVLAGAAVVIALGLATFTVFRPPAVSPVRPASTGFSEEAGPLGGLPRAERLNQRRLTATFEFAEAAKGLRAQGLPGRSQPYADTLDRLEQAKSALLDGLSKATEADPLQPSGAGPELRAWGYKDGSFSLDREGRRAEAVLTDLSPAEFYRLAKAAVQDSTLADKGVLEKALDQYRDIHAIGQQRERRTGS